MHAGARLVLKVWPHLDIRYSVIRRSYYSPICSQRCSLSSNYISNVYLIPFLMSSICFHVTLVYAYIINNDIDNMGANNWGCEKVATGVIHS